MVTNAQNSKSTKQLFDKHAMILLLVYHYVDYRKKKTFNDVL